MAAGLAFGLTLSAGTAFAQEAHRVRGTVESLKGNTLNVMSREGESVAITLNDGWGVSGVAAAEMSDIASGDFVGIASLPMEDGKPGALEVLIFPEAMAGTGEGSYPWDLQEGSTMTNATVSDKVESVDGNTLSLSYDGDQTKDIVVPDGTPVVTFADASKDDLVEGAPVFVPGEMAADGMISTGRVVVGKDGVVPPM